jgi:protein O-mannosyl-transferase
MSVPAYTRRMLRAFFRLLDTRFSRTAGVLLFALSAAVYWASLNNAFLNYDDNILVTGNPAIPSHSWAAFKLLLTTFDPELYVPLTFLSLKLDYVLGGMQPFMFHFTGMVLHAANALLAAMLLRQLLRGRTWIALALGAVFAVHPLNTEAVAWVSARKDLLSAFFCFASAYAYLRSVETGDRRRYWLALGCFVLGLLSKVSIAPLPAALLLMEWRVGTLHRPGLARDIAPFAAASLVFAAIAVAGKAGVLGGGGAGWLLLAPAGTLFLLGKFLWPSGLSVIYPFTGEISLWNPAVGIPFTVTAAGIACLLPFMRRARGTSFGVLFFLIMLTPSFFTAWHNGDWYLTSDRYAYVPMLGLLYLVGRLLNRIRFELVPAAFMAAAIAALAVTANARSADWRGSRALFESVLRVTDQSQVAYVKVGGALLDDGETEAAREAFGKSLAIRRNEQALYNMGLLLLQEGKDAEALALNEEAIRINPRYAPAYVNAGYLRYAAGDMATAVAYFEKAVGLEPAGVEQRLNLAAILAPSDPARAAALLDEILALDPRHADANALKAELGR